MYVPTIEIFINMKIIKPYKGLFYLFSLNHYLMKSRKGTFGKYLRLRKYMCTEEPTV